MSKRTFRQTDRQAWHTETNRHKHIADRPDRCGIAFPFKPWLTQKILQGQKHSVSPFSLSFSTSTCLFPTSVRKLYIISRQAVLMLDTRDYSDYTRVLKTRFLPNLQLKVTLMIEAGAADWNLGRMHLWSSTTDWHSAGYFGRSMQQSFNVQHAFRHSRTATDVWLLIATKPVSATRPASPATAFLRLAADDLAAGRSWPCGPLPSVLDHR